MLSQTKTATCALLALAVLAVLMILAQPAVSGDMKAETGATATGEWPQWRGPDRNNVSRETGLLASWPADGPKLLWKAQGLGGGYGSLAVAGGRIFGMGYRGDDEILWAREAGTGKEAWTARIATADRKVGVGDGTRSTPSVDGDRVYGLGVEGDLVCLSAADGKLRWQKNLVKDFGGGKPGFGYCESVLVDGDRVVATPGGKDATLVALNKLTGEPVWKAQVPEGDAAQYASAIAADVNGQREYIQFLSRGVVGVSAKDGKFLWRYDKPANGSANCSTPIFHDNQVFAASSYGKGGGLAKLAANGDAITATEVYFTRQMKNHHGGMVLVNGYLYGFDEAILTCLNFETGQVAWDNRSVGKGSVLYADGRLYVLGEGGTMGLIEASPSGYVEKGRFTLPDRSGKNLWAHPVIAGGRLYLRDQDTLLCYDIRQSMAAGK
jgi:outer membrane protein assembly factor BamB